MGKWCQFNFLRKKENGKRKMVSVQFPQEKENGVSSISSGKGKWCQFNFLRENGVSSISWRGKWCHSVRKARRRRKRLELGNLSLQPCGLTNPARQSLASSRKRVLRGGGKNGVRSIS